MKFSTLIYLSAAVLPMAAAHGVVHQFTANGKNYAAPDAAEGNPFKQMDTPVRQLALLEPINDLTSVDTRCGRGAASHAEETAHIPAGSSFSFSMIGGGGAPWPHVWGPIQAYLGKCSGPASSCDANSVRWFKIDQLGTKQAGVNVWWQEDLHNGSSVSMTVPKAVEDGDYLLRLEIFALHNAMNPGGAEVTVSCTQVHVSGGDGVAPSAEDLVTFPAAYKDSEGLVFDIWNGFKTYPFPGPALFTGKDSTDDSSATAHSHTSHPSASASAPINAAPKPTSEPAPAPTKSCKRKRSDRLRAARHNRRAIVNGAHRYASIQ